jgi:hypothetical protein
MSDCRRIPKVRPKLIPVVMKSETHNLDWIGQAPAPGFLRTSLAIFVATAVGAVSAVVVVLSLLSTLTAEPQSGLAFEAAHFGVSQPTPRPVAPSTDSAFSTASEDVSSNISRGQLGLSGTPSTTDQLPLTPGKTIGSGGMTSTSNGVDHREQTQFDRRQSNYAVHQRRAYPRRFAKTFQNLPFPRRW